MIIFFFGDIQYSTVGAKSMARAKSMAPDHTANDIMQIKQKFWKIFSVKDIDGAIWKQDLEKKIWFFCLKSDK